MAPPPPLTGAIGGVPPLLPLPPEGGWPGGPLHDEGGADQACCSQGARLGRPARRRPCRSARELRRRSPRRPQARWPLVCAPRWGVPSCRAPPSAARFRRPAYPRAGWYDHEFFRLLGRQEELVWHGSSDIRRSRGGVCGLGGCCREGFHWSERVSSLPIVEASERADAALRHELREC